MLQFLYEFQFAQRALFVGLIVGVLCPLIGVFIVARRLSVVGEVLSNMSLAGMALGSLLGSMFPVLKPIGPSFYSILFAVIGAFLVELLRKVYAYFSELAIPVLLSFGIGFGVVLFSLKGGLNVNFANFLFGNLFSINDFDVKMIVFIGLAVITLIALFYKELLLVTFDEEFAGITGIRKNVVHNIFILLMALTIAVTVQAVGVMLISGLMVFPVAAGMIIAKGFKKTIFYSICFSEFSILIGLVLAYYFDIASGGAIIIAACVLFSFALMFSRIRHKLRTKE